MNREISNEIVRWSGTSIFRIDALWLGDEVIKGVMDDFSFDYQRYYPGEDVQVTKIKYFPGLVATLLYRIARYYYLKNEEAVSLEFSSLARFLSGLELYYSAHIGKGFKVNHGMGLVVGARSSVGDNCLFHHGVTIGDRNGGRPNIGNNVRIYPGSSVLGAVNIGDDVVIGANTVVFENIEANRIVVGNPNRILHGKN